MSEPAAVQDGWTLPAALGVRSLPECIAIVGAGGKSSLMLALARALDGPTVVTTTTRLFAWQAREAAALLGTDVRHYAELVPADLERKALVVVGATEDDKVAGVPETWPAELLGRSRVRNVLVEADGARQLPVKAPAEHEPVIPPATTLAVVVAGIDAVGPPIERVAHRPERVAALTGRAVESVLAAEDLAALLTHPLGGLKGIPPAASVVIFLNKVTDVEKLSLARRVARLLLSDPRVGHVVLGEAQAPQPVREVHRRVAAVVLAAGEGRRMGRTKQLLPWGDTTVLGQTLRNLRQSSVDELLVVSGHDAAAVRTEALAAGAVCLHNPLYATGEMLSSLQAAMEQLPARTAAVLVTLADQPLVSAATIDRLLEAFWQHKGSLIAPVYQGQRGNPVLIDRQHFTELLTLPSGAAPRDLLKRHPVHLVPVDSDGILMDLDRPQDYERLRPQA